MSPRAPDSPGGASPALGEDLYVVVRVAEARRDVIVARPASDARSDHAELLLR